VNQESLEKAAQVIAETKDPIAFHESLNEILKASKFPEAIRALPVDKILRPIIKFIFWAQKDGKISGLELLRQLCYKVGHLELALSCHIELFVVR
jgi:hypothetical protein